MRKEQSRREQHQRRGKTGCACVCGFLCSWTCYLLFEIEATPQLLLLCTFCLFDYWLPDARVSFISAGQKLEGQQSCSRSMKEREREQSFSLLLLHLFFLPGSSSISRFVCFAGAQQLPKDVSLLLAISSLWPVSSLRDNGTIAEGVSVTGTRPARQHWARVTSTTR